ncbi:hypothetical protein KZC51_02730 [Microbacterium sp. SSW1-49]|uniref:DUF3325 domain-containing protein n=1 Tax=Microbacterium croceum TaxID=2851645 RepID=A0ABT0FBB4_9MICO|nr:hypothetical protein [Microbacterium croceum]MCK2035041.1 hypothetical protein [Microbacterium croceum]
MNVFGIATALAGVVLFLAALLATLRANRDVRIPYGTRPATQPHGSVAMRALGAGLTVLGAVLVGQTSVWWALAIVVAGPGVALVAIAVHNARIRRLPRSSSAG